MDTLTPIRLGDLWMELKDRTLLAALMEQQGVTRRDLAESAGWKAHSYVNRLLSGEAKTLKTDPAARIAHRLGVPFSLLFVTRVDDKSERSGRKGRAA